MQANVTFPPERTLIFFSSLVLLGMCWLLFTQLWV